MKATVKYVEEKFSLFNKMIFAGRLPSVPVRLSDAASFMGMCVSKVRRLPDGRRQHNDFELRISVRIDLPEQTLDDIIIHEMIHYFINYNGLVDSSPHGEIFKSIMSSINKTYGRNISITHRTTPEQRKEAAESRRTWHVIAAVSFKDGKMGLKVLPRIHSTIIRYHNTVSADSGIASVDLYLSDNPFFNRYPNSGSLRIYSVAKDELIRNLEDAEALVIRGNEVCRKKE